MKRLEENIRFLKLLAGAKSPRERGHILEGATREQLLAIREICLNLCGGRIPLPEILKRKLKRYVPHIRKLARRDKAGTRALKERLRMSGGFLSLILPAILGLISTVGGRAIAKAIGV